MRCSMLLAALPALAAAQEGAFAQYKAQFQNFLGNFGAAKEVAQHPVAAAEAKVGALTISVLTLNNWKDTLYAPVKANAKQAEEWLVFITGGNKTCYGQCTDAEKAFNETAGKFAVLPKKPHMGLINCDNEPVLCNSWSANVGTIWSVNLLPAPAPVDIYTARQNLSSVTSESIVNDYKNDRKGYTLLDSYFHPFDGKLAELGVAVPLAYVIWGFSLLPQWAFMVIVSFGSRFFMGNRMAGQRGAGAPGAPAAAPAAQ